MEEVFRHRLRFSEKLCKISQRDVFTPLLERFDLISSSPGHLDVHEMTSWAFPPMKNEQLQRSIEFLC